MALGIYEEEDIRAIAESIRANAFTSKTYTTKEMPNGVSEVFGAARQEGYDKGYPEGYETGYEVGYYEAYAKGNDDGYITGEREGRIAAYNEVEPLNAELEQILYGRDTGGEGFWGEFWDNFQNYGNRESYTYAFRFWNDTMFKPKYDIKPTGQYGADQMFYQTEIVDIVGCLKKQGVSIDFSNATRLSSTFDRTTAATTIPPIDATSCTSMSLTFYSSQKIKSIEINNLKEECTFDRVFHYVYGLETLAIEGTIGQNGFDVQSSTKLSKASIENIVSVLSSTSTDKSVTLSKTAVNKAFETSVGANDGSTSSAWLNIIATKNNWTISLV